MEKSTPWNTRYPNIPRRSAKTSVVRNSFNHRTFGTTGGAGGLWNWQRTAGSSKMNSAMSTAIDSLLSRSPNVCGGRVRIDGTRVTVLQIVTCYQQGLTPEEIADQYPHVNLAQIYAALTYYHANRDEIDRELEAEAAEFDRLANEFAKPQE